MPHSAVPCQIQRGGDGVRWQNALEIQRRRRLLAHMVFTAYRLDRNRGHDQTARDPEQDLDADGEGDPFVELGGKSKQLHAGSWAIVAGDGPRSAIPGDQHGVVAVAIAAGSLHSADSDRHSQGGSESVAALRAGTRREPGLPGRRSPACLIRPDHPST